VTEEFCVYLIGPPNAGKTTFVRTMSQSEVSSVDSQGDEYHNTAFNEGKLYLGLDIIQLRSIVNNRRFDYLWLEKQETCLGVILLIDSSELHHFREARSHAEAMLTYCSLPWIIVANKQDKPYAASISDLRYMLRIPSEIPVVPCVAKEYNSVKQVLLALLEETLKSIESEQ
jgi:signal recognition particle receptor subunit beta